MHWWTSSTSSTRTPKFDQPRRRRRRRLQRRRRPGRQPAGAATRRTRSRPTPAPSCRTTSTPTRSRTSRSFYDDAGLTDAFPQDLVDRLTVDGKIYSVPSNIHRANVVWANPDVLKKAGLDPAKPAADLDAWIADLEKIKESGVTPLSVGRHVDPGPAARERPARHPWRRGYNGLWDGTTDWDGADVTNAIENYEKRSATPTPTVTASRLGPGHAAGGSTARRLQRDGRLGRSQVRPGRQEARRRTTSTSRPPGPTASSTSWPTRSRCPGRPEPRRREGLADDHRFASTASRPFNKAKGSIPARTDGLPTTSRSTSRAPSRSSRTTRSCPRWPTVPQSPWPG